MTIEVEGLIKRYGDHVAVDGIDLHVAEGEIVAFLGPNGAGKTTTIEILEGFRKRDAGDVAVLGIDPGTAPLEWRERIGIVLQESEPIPELTARESIAQQAAYYRNSRNVDEVLGIVGLTGSADQRTRKLSGGQKRRLDLAQALVGDPDLVFLDEPTTGFDPSARRESWDMIEALRGLGKTVLLTTHYMDEAERLADRIVVIADGRIVARGTAADLATQVNANTTISWRVDLASMPGSPPMPAELQVDGTGHGTVSIASDEVTRRLHALTGWALETGVDLRDLQVRRPTLEDVYLVLTDRPAGTGGVES